MPDPVENGLSPTDTKNIEAVFFGIKSEIVLTNSE